MLVVVQYLAALLVCCIFLFLSGWFIVGLLQVWVFTNETRGMTKKQVKKAEQELCKCHNPICTESHPYFLLACFNCGKKVCKSIK